jgi:CubicO group peptidase (beta-lactamase class C family)
MSVPAGAGGLYSTVEDLYIWDQALYTEKLVTQKSLVEIFTPFKDGYGFGWNIGKKFNHEFIRHGGDIDGFATSICRYPDNKICIIVLSNYKHAPKSKISHGLEAIVWGEKYELPKIAVNINPEIYDQYTGKYKLKGKTITIITITKENNKLMYQASEQKIKFYPKSENEFFNNIANFQISFVRDEQGKVIKLIQHQVNKSFAAEKIE